MGDVAVIERTEIQPRRPGGRPTLYTEEKGRAICDIIRQGNSIVAACAVNGVSRDMFYDWVGSNESFCHMVLCARGEGEIKYSSCVLKAAEGDPQYKGDPRAAIEALKRIYRASGWGDALDIKHVDKETLLEMLQAAAPIEVTSVETVDPGDDLL